MEEKKLNEQESLELISRMIRNTQNRLEGNVGTPMLVWGYVTLAVTITVWCALHITGNDEWHYLWFSIPVLGILLMKAFNKKGPSGVKTYIDSVLNYVWVVSGVTCFIFCIVSFITHLNILSIVLLLMGISSMITGLVAKYVPVTIGGLVGILLSIVLIFIPSNADNFLMVFGIAFIAMSIIPGHILNYKGRKSMNKEVDNV